MADYFPNEVIITACKDYITSEGLTCPSSNTTMNEMITCIGKQLSGNNKLFFSESVLWIKKNNYPLYTQLHLYIFLGK